LLEESLCNSGTYQGSLKEGDRTDFYQFTIATGILPIRLELSGTADLVLLDAAGIEVKRATVTAGTMPAIDTALSAGVYYAQIIATEAIDYTFTLSDESAKVATSYATVLLANQTGGTATADAAINPAPFVFDNLKNTQSPVFSF
jgi:hypothetical protein